MTEPSSENGVTPPANTPETPPATLPATPPVAPQSTPPNPSQVDLAGLYTAINALPERIANAIQEAAKPAKPPVSTPPPTDSGSKDNGDEHKPKRSFASMWFGT